jgi:hypothetical protein
MWMTNAQRPDLYSSHLLSRCAKRWQKSRAALPSRMLPLRPFLLCATAFLLALLFPQQRAVAEPVWVVSNGFHTSLGFRARDVPQLAALTPERRADYVLIGWGDADFYRFPAMPWRLVKAVCWPTPGALHIVPVRGPLTGTLANSDIIQFELGSVGFAKMRRHIEKHLSRDRQNSAIPLGKGYTATSRFYVSRESFYFLKCATCGSHKRSDSAACASSPAWRSPPKACNGKSVRKAAG